MPEYVPIFSPEGVELVEAPEPGFFEKLKRFKAKAEEALSLFSRLQQLEPVALADPDPTARANYGRIMGLWGEVSGTIETITRGVGAAWDYVTGLFGINKQELGVAPIAIGVSVAFITTASAAVAAWVTEARREVRRLESIERLTAQGMSPQDAYRLVKEQEKGIFAPFFEAAGSGVGLALIVGTVLFFLTRRKR